MDDRTRRLGEHAALTLPLWAGQALGPLPADPAGRLGWEHRAGIIAAYRERYGHDHPADPIGAEPGRTSPEARAAWHGALAALGRTGGIDLRHLSDGALWLRRGTYERETAWAPPHAAADLKLVRTAGRDAHVNALRAEHETRAARRRRAAARHADLARLWRAVAAKAAAEEQLLAAVQDTRRRWELVSESTRRIAIAADTELRRRRPGTPIAPLRPHPAEATAGRLRQPEAERLAALGLTPETAGEAIPPELHQLRQRAATVQYRLDELSSLRLPAAEHDELSPGLAWPEHVRGRRDAVLQPARREIEPSFDVQAAHASRAGAGEPEREQEREAE